MGQDIYMYCIHVHPPQTHPHTHTHTHTHTHSPVCIPPSPSPTFPSPLSTVLLSYSAPPPWSLTPPPAQPPSPPTPPTSADTEHVLYSLQANTWGTVYMHRLSLNTKVQWQSHRGSLAAQSTCTCGERKRQGKATYSHAKMSCLRQHAHAHAHAHVHVHVHSISTHLLHCYQLSPQTALSELQSVYLLLRGQ